MSNTPLKAILRDTMYDTLYDSEIRLVEPDDFNDAGSIQYQANVAYLMMRDKPTVYAPATNELIIEPAPVKQKVWWFGKTFDLPYHDKTVSITHAGSTLSITHKTDISDTTRRGIYSMTLTLADRIYATTYRSMFDAGIDTIRTYVSTGAAMTLEFPQSHQFLTYGVSDDKNIETFALHTPGVSEATYRAEAKIIVQKNNQLVRRLWTCNRTSYDDAHTENHDSTAVEVVAMRNKLERYAWHNIRNDGMSAPVGWQYMDTILSAPTS